ncbi:hypothetical protein ACQ4WQ_14730 [Janthinobacterium sp. GB1R12]|uniref:hypothetical protein n=1 Tax=Janthinobacterium sp. GB1R12 TaxID=3424190 RepID=UPI003F29B80C
MDDDEYEFWIDAYTPETIPMERLAKYLAALAKMMGHSSSVHFDRLETGSTKSLMKVQREDAPKVFDRVELIAKRQAANDAAAAFDELNSLLRDDSAVGKLSRKTPDSQTSAVVLNFLGRELPKPATYGPFNEDAVVEGELVRIGGKDKSAHALIVDPEGKSWSGEMDRDLARDMAQYLYKGTVLRVSGEARWERLENASWRLMVFKIKSFKVLADDTLDDATKRLRSLHKTDWNNVGDVDAFITASRGESDGLH